MNGILNGDGSKLNPYQITDAADLNAMRNNVNACYVLMNNIDMSEFNSLSTIGWTQIVDFYGDLNGNGHYIVNLKINATGVSYTAFIKTLYGSIRNLGFVEASIIGGTYTSAFCYTGTANATIENCFITGMVQGESYVASFVAGTWNSISFKNNFSTATIRATSNYATGLIDTLAINSNATDCYFAGTLLIVSASTGQYGLIRTITGTMTDCFFNSELTTSTVSTGALTTSGFKLAANFTSWTDKYTDTRSIWDLKDGKYPLLSYLTDSKYVIKCDGKYMSIVDSAWVTFSTDTTVLPTDDQLQQWGLNNYEVSLVSRSLWNELRKYGKFEFISQVNRYEYNETVTSAVFTKYKDILGGTLYKAPLDVSLLTSNLLSIEILQ